MKRTSIFLSAAALVLTAACNKEVPAPEVQDALTIVSVGLPQQTKTSLSEENAGVRQVLWSAGDQIAVNGVASRELPASAEGSKCADFAFDVVIPTPSSQQPWNIVYPASAYKDEATITLAQTQQIAEGNNVVPDVLPMAVQAVSESVTLSHLCGILSFQLQKGSDEDQIDYLEVSARGGEQLCGDFAIDYATGALSAKSGEASVKVVIEKALTAGSNTVVNVVVPAGTYSDGFDVNIADKSGRVVAKSLGGTKSVVAGNMIVMKSGVTIDVNDLFMTPAGAGTKDGHNWENAMDPAALKAACATTAVADKNIRLAAGTYVFDTFTSVVDVKFYGGYPTGLTGTSISGRNIETNLTIITAEKGHRVSNIQNPVTIYFEGISFENANHTSNGAVAYLDKGSALEFESCKFKNNVVSAASSKYGGCFAYNNNTITINNCYFSGSNAYRGGCFCSYNADGKLIATNCTFENNTVTQDAAVSINSGGIQTFENCTFNNNSTTGWISGAIAANTNSTTIARNCTFNGCKATNGIGGAVGVQNATVTLENCTFKNCSAKNGGAIGLDNVAAVINMTGCTFDGNRGTAQAGVVYNNTAIKSFNASSCTFKNNVSAGYGGVIYCANANNVWHFDGCYFEGNVQASRGMFFCNGDNVLMMNNCQFYNNKNAPNENTWGVLTHYAAIVCANNITFYNDGSIPAQTIFGTDRSVLLTNSTMVMSTTGTDSGLVRTNGGKIVLANNILLKRGGNAICVDAGSCVTRGHNVYGVSAGKGYTPAATDKNISAESSLGSSAAYSVAQKAFVWNGPSVLDGFTAASKDDIIAAIGDYNINAANVTNVGAAFKTWLESLPSHPLDRSYAWPGAYVPAN